MVDLFEKAYTGLVLPKYEGKEDAAFLEAFAELQKEAETAVAASRKRLVELEAEMAKLKLEKAGIRSMTVDDVLAADPKMAEEINQELVAGKWY